MNRRRILAIVALITFLFAIYQSVPKTVGDMLEIGNFKKIVRISVCVSSASAVSAADIYYTTDQEDIESFVQSVAHLPAKLYNQSPIETNPDCGNMYDISVVFFNNTMFLTMYSNGDLYYNNRKYIVSSTANIDEIFSQILQWQQEN